MSFKSESQLTQFESRLSSLLRQLDTGRLLEELQSDCLSLCMDYTAPPEAAEDPSLAAGKLLVAKWRERWQDQRTLPVNNMISPLIRFPGKAVEQEALFLMMQNMVRFVEDGDTHTRNALPAELRESIKKYLSLRGIGSNEPAEWSDYHTPYDWRVAWGDGGTPASEKRWRNLRDSMKCQQHPVSKCRRVRFLISELEKNGLQLP